MDGDMDGNLVPIGRFSKMTRLSIKALRHYDDVGVLRPHWVDPDSSYRYYRVSQARRAEAIRQLRGVGMPLDEITEILGHDDMEVVRKMLDTHRRRLVEQLAESERRLRFLESLIEREEGVVPYEVTVKEIPAMDIASVRKHVSMSTVAQVIGQAFGEVMGAVAASGSQPAGAPFLVFHDVIDEDTDGDIEVCIPVPGPIDGIGDVTGTRLETATFATTIHHGPYNEVGPAYHTLTAWIQDHGHEMAGPPREIYLNDPTVVGEEEQLTEVAWPIC